MKLVEAQNYVMENGRYSKDAPSNSRYYVRFPRLTSSKVFFSGDTEDLVKQVFAFGRTKDGRNRWKTLPKGKYLACHDHADEDE